MTLRLVPPDQPVDDDLLLTAAHAAAAELHQPTARHAAVVGWLSTHAAALEHVVYPAARRAGLDITAQSDLTRRLEHVLLQLHQAVNGDGRGAGAHAGAVAHRLDDVLQAHTAGLAAVLTQLKQSLPPDDWAALVARHDAALCGAPSRPHPHTPHGTVGERVAFTIAGAVDRLLDALDSRVVPPLPAQPDAVRLSVTAQPA